MPLSRHSVGTYRDTSSHATRQGTLGHSRLRSLSHCGLIWPKEWNKCARANLHFKKRKKEKDTGGDEWSNLLQKTSQARKATEPPRKSGTPNIIKLDVLQSIKNI